MIPVDIRKHEKNVVQKDPRAQSSFQDQILQSHLQVEFIVHPWMPRWSTGSNLQGQCKECRYKVHNWKSRVRTTTFVNFLAQHCTVNSVHELES